MGITEEIVFGRILSDNDALSIIMNRISAAMNAKKSEHLGMHTVLNLIMLS